MPQSQCNEYLNLPPDTRERILPHIISIYVDYLIRNGELDKALRILHNAYRKGYINEYIEKLYKTAKDLAQLKLLVDVTRKIIEHLGEVPPDFILKMIDRLHEVRGRLENILPDDAKQGLDRLEETLRDAYNFTVFYDKATSTLQDAVEKINTFINYSKTGEPLLALENAFGYGREVFPQIINAINDVIEESTTTPIHTPEIENAKHRIVDTLIKTRSMLKGLYAFSKHGARIIGHLHALLNNLSQYGGNNVLAEKTYYNTLLSDIVNILEGIKNLKEETIITEYPEDIRSSMNEFIESITNYINNLKKNLGSKDPRFVDLFEEAESRTGVNLVDVPKGNPVSSGLEEFVRNVAENSRLAFNSDNTILKILGGIALVGSGALDNLTILLRPETLKQQLQALWEAINNTAENIKKEGFEGFRKSAEALFNDMFGTPDRALYSLGGILSAIAIAIAVKKLPVPKRLKPVLTDLLQADPIGLAISSLEASGIAGFLKQLIVKHPGETGTVKVTLPDGYNRFVEEALEEAYRKAEAKHVLKVSDVLSKKIAHMLRKGIPDIKSLRKAIREVLEKHSLQQLVNDYNRFLNVKASILEQIHKHATYTGKSLIDKLVREAVGEGKTVVKKLKDLLPEDVYTQLLENTKLYKLLTDIDVIRKSIIPSLKEIIEKYKDMFSPEEAEKMLRKLDEAYEKLDEGYYAKAWKLLQDINEYLSSQLDWETVRKNIASNLEDIAPSKYVKQLLEADTPVEFLAKLYKTLDKLAEKLEPSRIQVINSILDTLKTLEKTKLGKAFEYLRNRVLRKIRVEITSAPDEFLSRSVNEMLNSIRIDKLPEPLRNTLSKIREKALRGEVTITDVERLVDNIAAINPKKAGEIYASVMARFLRNVMKHLDELKDSSLIDLEIYRRIHDKITETLKLVSPGKLVEETTTLAPAPLNLAHTLKTLVKYMEDLDPTYASKLSKLVDKLLEEYKTGTLTRETLEQLFHELHDGIRKAKNIKPSLLERIRNTLIQYMEWLDIKYKHKPEALKTLRNLADVVKKDIDELMKEIRETRKYGYIEYTVKRRKYRVKQLLPGILDPETLRRIQRILDTEPHVEKTIKIGNMEIKGSRTVTLEPDGTYTLRYTLLFPENHKLDILLTYRPVETLVSKLKNIGKALVGEKLEAYSDVYARVFYDPALRNTIITNKVLREAITSGRILELIDPEYKLLTRIRPIPVVKPLDTGKILATVLGLTLGAQALRKYPELAPVIKQDLVELVETLQKKGLLVYKPHAIKDILLVTGEVRKGKYRIVTGIPLDVNKLRNRIIGYVRLRLGNKQYIIPKLRIGNETILYIPQVELEVLQQKHVELPEEPKTYTPPTPTPIPTTPTEVPTGAGTLVEPAFTLKTREKTGKQIEVLEL